MEDAKIQFSAADMELMCNAGIILTKNRILAGIRALLEGLQAQMERELYQARGIPEALSGAVQVSGKVSKGENYLGLPYLVLDYPRCFDSQNIFALRTLFWWGNIFSSTLHLSGSYARKLAPLLVDAHDLLAGEGYFLGVQEEDPWQHHFGPDNYRPVVEFDADAFAERLEQCHHIKLALPFPLRNVHFVADELLESWKRLLRVCGVVFTDTDY